MPRNACVLSRNLQEVVHGVCECFIETKLSLSPNHRRGNTIKKNANLFPCVEVGLQLLDRAIDAMKRRSQEGSHLLALAH